MITAASNMFRFVNMALTAVAVFAALAAWTLIDGEDGQERLLLAVIVLLAGLVPTGRPAFECRTACYQLQAIRAISVAAACTAVTVMLAWWVADATPPWGEVAAIDIAASVALMAGFCLAVSTGGQRRVAIVGTGAFAVAAARRLAADGDGDGIRVVGFLDQDPPGRANAPLPFPLLARLDRGAVDTVVVALPRASEDDVARIRARLAGHRVDIVVAAPLLDAAPARVGSLPVMRVGPRQLTWIERAAKRAFDVAFASVALALMAPVMLACAIAIRLESAGPVIYRQRRYTTDGRLFVLYKFRSMRSDPEPTGEIRLTDRNDSRVTRVGAFLRRTSLDELPQFINVLQGHMSVVGPRPHPPGVKVGDRIYEEVIANFADRYVVKPGITGWAQVSGLRGNTFTERHLEERFSADLEYIRNWCLSLEILIVLKTVFGGFAGKNAF